MNLKKTHVLNKIEMKQVQILNVIRERNVENSFSLNQNASLFRKFTRLAKFRLFCYYKNYEISGLKLFSTVK